MKKKNKIATLLKMIYFCLATVFLLSGSKSAATQAAEVTVTPEATQGIQHVYDDAGLLSSSELSDIEEMCTSYSKEAGIDIIILTHDNPRDTDNGAYIEDFVDRTDYDNSVVLSIDMAGRNVDLQGYGQAETYLHSKRLDAIREKITSYLRDADYVNAFKIYIEDSAAYMKDDTELNTDHNYTYDKNGNYTGTYDSGYNSQDTTVRDVLTNGFFQLIVALIISGIVVGIMVYNSGGKMTAGGNNYIDGGHSGLIGRRDNYIRTTVTRVRKPTQNNRPGGFNAGGFSGGISGGGHSHSSSHGKF
jgi:uncharacterized protein